MTTLRKMIDSGELDAASSPMATHISKHVQDPVGATRKGFERLAKAKMEYDLAREEAKRELLPVSSVLEHVDQMHQLTDPMSGLPMNGNPDEEMGYDEDPTMPGQNMGQKPGMMQQSKPGMVKTAPGTGPRIPGGQPGQAGTASQRQVVPQKMNMPQPGQARIGGAPRNPARPQPTMQPQPQPGMPGGKPQQKTAGGKPGAAGQKAAPGKKAPQKKGNSVKVEVQSGSDYGIKTKGYRQLHAGIALSSLRFGGAGSGCHGPNCGRPAKSAAKEAGYQAKRFSDVGTGRYAGKVITYEHPDGHTLKIGTGPAKPDNYWEHTHKDGTKTEGALNDLKQLKQALGTKPGTASGGKKSAYDHTQSNWNELPKTLRSRLEGERGIGSSEWNRNSEDSRFDLLKESGIDRDDKF